MILFLVGFIRICVENDLKLCPFVGSYRSIVIHCEGLFEN